MHASTFSLLSLFLALTLPVNAFFRMPCDQLIAERVDPIVFPGAISGHTHTISGGSNFSPSSSFADMRKSQCTSCLAKADLSAYWSPQLYFMKKDKSVESVKGGGMLVYYLFRSHSSDKAPIQAFPTDYKVLAGNPFLRTYDPSSLTQSSIGWNCLGSSSPTRLPGLPTRNCPNGLRGEVRFPSCYNGKPYSSDQSAYSDGESGPCPASHPIRLPTLFFEIFYQVDAFKDRWNEAFDPKSPFILATGDPTGYGMHGDFLNGWDQSILQSAIETCDTPSSSGEIEDCKVLELYNRSVEGTCRKTPDVNEIVLGSLKSLPGCNPRTNTMADALAGIKSCPDLKAPEVFATPSVFTGNVAPPGSKVLSNVAHVAPKYQSWRYSGCYYHPSGRQHLTQKLSIPIKNVQTCLLAAQAAGYNFAGLEWGGECWVGEKLPGSKKGRTEDYGRCDMACDGAKKQICGGSNAMTVYSLKKTTTTKRHVDMARLASH